MRYAIAWQDIREEDRERDKGNKLVDWEFNGLMASSALESWAAKRAGIRSSDEGCVKGCFYSLAGFLGGVMLGALSVSVGDDTGFLAEVAYRTGGAVGGSFIGGIGTMGSLISYSVFKSNKTDKIIEERKRRQEERGTKRFIPSRYKVQQNL